MNSAGWQEWVRTVREEMGEEALDRLRSVTLDGVEVDPLYARDHGAPSLPRPIRAGRGWETWSPFPGGPVDAVGERIEALRRLGVTGLWLESAEAVEPAVLRSIVTEAAGRDLALAVRSTSEGVRLADAMADHGGELRGCLGLDPMTASRSLLKEASDRCVARLPGIRPFLLSAEFPDDAGAGAVFELAWLVTGISELFESGTAEGLPADRLARQVVLLLPVGRDVHLQIAKLRAARVLWSMVVGAWGVDAAEIPARILARTSRRTKSRWDAETNLLRETVECFAAVVGGCDALLPRPFDGGESERARRLQATLPLVLRDESGLDRVEDPAGGSWTIEALTRRLAERAWDEARTIETEGGLLAALTSGGLRGRMEAAAETRRRGLRTRREPVTGISLHPRPEEAPGRTAPAPAAKRAGEDLPVWSDASLFEVFRDRAAERDEPPRALVVGIGSLRELSAALGFARQLLVAGGFRVETPDPVPSVAEARSAVSDAAGDVVVPVLPRDADEARRQEVATALAEATSSVLALTGAQRVDGVDHYLHAGCDAVALLEDLWAEVEG